MVFHIHRFFDNLALKLWAERNRTQEFKIFSQEKLKNTTFFLIFQFLESKNFLPPHFHPVARANYPLFPEKLIFLWPILLPKRTRNIPIFQERPKLTHSLFLSNHKKHEKNKLECMSFPVLSPPFFLINSRQWSVPFYAYWIESQDSFPALFGSISNCELIRKRETADWIRGMCVWQVDLFRRRSKDWETCFKKAWEEGK